MVWNLMKVYETMSFQKVVKSDGKTSAVGHHSDETCRVQTFEDGTDGSRSLFEHSVDCKSSCTGFEAQQFHWMWRWWLIVGELCFKPPGCEFLSYPKPCVISDWRWRAHERGTRLQKTMSFRSERGVLNRSAAHLNSMVPDDLGAHFDLAFVISRSLISTLYVYSTARRSLLWHYKRELTVPCPTKDIL